MSGTVDPVVAHRVWCPALTDGDCICQPKPPRLHPDRYHRIKDSVAAKRQREYFETTDPGGYGRFLNGLSRKERRKRQ